MKNLREPEGKETERHRTPDLVGMYREAPREDAEGARGDHGGVEGGCAQQSAAEQLDARIPGRTAHEPRLGRLEGQRERGEGVCDEVDPEDLQRE